MDAPGANGIPTSFNVIDTPDIVDPHGYIELFTGIMPLMRDSTVSTIQMEAITLWTDEVNLFNELLSGAPFGMCNSFHVAPIALLTGINTRGLIQDLPVLDFSSKTLRRYAIAWYGKYPHRATPSMTPSMRTYVRVSLAQKIS